MKIGKHKIINIEHYNRVKDNLIRRLATYIKEFGSYEFTLDTQCNQFDTDFIASEITDELNKLKLNVVLENKSDYYSIRRSYV
jgi:hypothetical protein